MPSNDSTSLVGPNFRRQRGMSEDLIEDLSKLFSHGQQMWLLGAGASFESNLPLVKGLTERVRNKLAEAPFEDGEHPRRAWKPRGVADVTAFGGGVRAKYAFLRQINRSRANGCGKPQGRMTSVTPVRPRRGIDGGAQM